MAQILVGTRDGLHRFDGSGSRFAVEHAGREVTTIGPEGWELWAILDGKEVFLCWEQDEEDIEFWHDLHSGYAGRERL